MHGQGVDTGCTVLHFVAFRRLVPRGTVPPFLGFGPILFTLVGQTIALCGLPPSGTVGRRHKTIVCPTETSLSEQHWGLVRNSSLRLEPWLGGLQASGSA